MAEHLAIPGAFTYLRLLPTPIKKKEIDLKKDLSENETSNENNSKQSKNIISNIQVPVEESVESEIKDNKELINTGKDQETEQNNNNTCSDDVSVVKNHINEEEPKEELKEKENNNISIKPTNVAIAVDIWKQKTHDRKKHYYDFDRFMKEGISPDTGSLSDNTSDWSTIKVQHDELDLAIRILEVKKKTIYLYFQIVGDAQIYISSFIFNFSNFNLQ